MTKINIISGEFESLLQYSDISKNLELTTPENVCSISIIENLVFIAYSIISDTTRKNIVIRVNIKDKDDSNGPTIDTIYEKKYFIYSIAYTELISIRHFACEAIYIKNDESNYRLICAYETKESKYVVKAFVIRNNLDELDANGQENSLFSINSASGIRLFRMDPFNIRAVMRKKVCDLSLQNNYGVINIIVTKANSNLNAYSATRNLYDYNNNFIISSEVYKKNFMRGSSSPVHS